MRGGSRRSGSGVLLWAVLVLVLGYTDTRHGALAAQFVWNPDRCSTNFNDPLAFDRRFSVPTASAASPTSVPQSVTMGFPASDVQAIPGLRYAPVRSLLSKGDLVMGELRFPTDGTIEFENGASIHLLEDAAARPAYFIAGQPTDPRVEQNGCDFGCHQNYLEVLSPTYNLDVPLAAHRQAGSLRPADRRPCNGDTIIFPKGYGFRLEAGGEYEVNDIRMGPSDRLPVGNATDFPKYMFDIGTNLRVTFGDEALETCKAEGLTSIADPGRCLCHTVCPVDNKQLLEQFLEHASRTGTQAEKETRDATRSVTRPFEVTLVSGALLSEAAVECFERVLAPTTTAAPTTTTTTTTSVAAVTGNGMTTTATTATSTTTTTTPSTPTPEDAKLRAALSELLSATWADGASVDVTEVRTALVTGTQPGQKAQLPALVIAGNITSPAYAHWALTTTGAPRDIDPLPTLASFEDRRARNKLGAGAIAQALASSAACEAELLGCDSAAVAAAEAACGPVCRTGGFASQLVFGSPEANLLANLDALFQGRVGDIVFAPSLADLRSRMINGYTEWSTTATPADRAAVTLHVQLSATCAAAANINTERRAARARLTSHDMPAVTVGSNLPQIMLPRLLDPFNQERFPRYLEERLSGFGPLVHADARGVELSLRRRFRRAEAAAGPATELLTVAFNYSMYTTGTCDEDGAEQEFCPVRHGGNRLRLVAEHIDHIVSLYELAYEPCFNPRELGEEPYGFDLTCIRNRVDEAIAAAGDGANLRSIAIRTFMDLAQCGPFGYAADGSCLDDSYIARARNLAETEADLAVRRNSASKSTDNTTIIIAVLAAVAVLVLILLAVLFVLRRNKIDPLRRKHRGTFGAGATNDENLVSYQNPTYEDAMFVGGDEDDLDDVDEGLYDMPAFQGISVTDADAEGDDEEDGYALLGDMVGSDDEGEASGDGGYMEPNLLGSESGYSVPHKDKTGAGEGTYLEPLASNTGTYMEPVAAEAEDPYQDMLLTQPAPDEGTYVEPVAASGAYADSGFNPLGEDSYAELAGAEDGYQRPEDLGYLDTSTSAYDEPVASGDGEATYAVPNKAAAGGGQAAAPDGDRDSDGYVSVGEDE